MSPDKDVPDTETAPDITGGSAIPRPLRYATAVIRGTWYACRSDGTRILTAGSPEGLQAVIAVDRRHWRPSRIPHTAPAAA